MRLSESFQKLSEHSKDFGPDFKDTHSLFTLARFFGSFQIVW